MIDRCHPSMREPFMSSNETSTNERSALTHGVGLSGDLGSHRSTGLVAGEVQKVSRQREPLGGQAHQGGKYVYGK